MDTVKRENTMVIENLFVDGDTRNITLKNPKSSIAIADIESLNDFMQANNIIIGDKAGATFGRITKVTRKQKVSTTFDLT
mgnify:FL=1